jgi:hypothetical protein
VWEEVRLAGENIGELCPIVFDCRCGLGGVGLVKARIRVYYLVG